MKRAHPGPPTRAPPAPLLARAPSPAALAAAAAAAAAATSASISAIAAAAAARGQPMSKKALSQLKKTGVGALPAGKGKTTVVTASSSSASSAPSSASAPSAAFAAAAARLFERSKATLSDMLNPVHSAFDTALKGRWPTMPRAQRQLVIDADLAALARRAAAAHDPETTSFPFEVAADDHCETSAEALGDAATLLRALALARGVEPASLRLYDPFYCAGASATHLAALGFPHVHNVKEDFHAAVREGRVPDFDVLVTNPAYSGDHMPRLLDFCAASGHPFLLLMPSYVAAKDWFAAASSAVAGGIVFVFPPKRYTYLTPHGLRDRAKTQAHSSAQGSRTSPFVSFWYCGGLGEHEEAVLAAATGPSKRLRCARTVDELPPSVRPVAGAFASAGPPSGAGTGSGAGERAEEREAAAPQLVSARAPTAAAAARGPAIAAEPATHKTAGSWRAAGDEGDREALPQPIEEKAMKRRRT